MCSDAGVVGRKQFILVGEEADGATGLQSNQVGTLVMRMPLTLINQGSTKFSSNNFELNIELNIELNQFVSFFQ